MTVADDRHRIFVAVPLSPRVRAAAAQAGRTLAADTGRFRWVASDHLHLTLHFLGEIPASSIAHAVEAAHEAATSAAPFGITLSGVGGFPSLAAPRVVWVGVTRGAERLAGLAGALEHALRARHLARDVRPFSPHLTLGRLRGDARPPDLRRVGESLAGASLGDEHVTEIVVVESVLGRSEPAYTVLARERLGSNVRIGPA